MSLSVALITFNEEVNIEACLESVKWADEIVLVDSGSTDQTLAKAHSFTDKVHKRAFTNFADQKNFALSHTSKDWVLFLDADERVTPELAAEIQLASASAGTTVYALRRLTYFFGRRLRFSGTRSDYPLRLFPRCSAHFEQPVHETLVTSLPVARMKHPLLHYSTRDFDHYKRKLRQYVELELETMKMKKRSVSWADRLIRPVAKFLMLYILKLGFLDGLAGLQYAGLSSFYDYLKYCKFYQSKRQS